MNDFGIDRAFAAAAEVGIEVEQFLLDGLWHRVRATTKGRANSDGSYCVREFVLRDGRRAVVGLVRNWHTSAEVALTLEGVSGIDPADMVEARRLAAESAAASKAEREQRQQETAARAEKIWAGLSEAGASEYLQRKRVRAWGVRFSRGAVVVPARDQAGKIWTLQFISPDGGKKFLTGGAKAGRFHIVGDLAGAATIGVAEGYATAASIYEATGIPVYVAFDAGNLAPVCQAARKAAPGAVLCVFADDDRGNRHRQAFIRHCDHNGDVARVVDELAISAPWVSVEVVGDSDGRLRESYNTGVSAAIIAAAKVGGSVVVPDFDRGRACA